MALNNTVINWDEIPDIITKDQLYRIYHISKSTALHLLKSGKVLCEWSGKKTRCYKIKKEDVKAYLEEQPFFRSSILHPVNGVTAIMWQGCLLNCPKKCSVKYTTITPASEEV